MHDPYILFEEMGVTLALPTVQVHALPCRVDVRYLGPVPRCPSPGECLGRKRLEACATQRFVRELLGAKGFVPKSVDSRHCRGYQHAVLSTE